MNTETFIYRRLDTAWFWTGFVFAVLLISTLWRVPAYIDVRFALMVKDIGVHGFSPLAAINGVTYGDYFSSWLWLSYLTTFGGRLSHIQFFLALPSILCCCWTTYLLFKLAEKTLQGTGAVAVLLLILNYEFIDNCTTFGLDIPVMAAAFTAIYCQVNEWRWRYWVFLGLALFSFVMRGPLGLVIYGISVGGYILGCWDWRNTLKYAVSGIVLGVLMLVGCWYVMRWSCGDTTLWDQMYLSQFGGRMNSKEELLFYFKTGFLNLLPGSALLLLALWCNRRKLREKEWCPWLVSIVLTLVVMSIPGCKKLRYVMVLFPIMALLASRCIPVSGLSWWDKGWAWSMKKLDYIVTNLPLPFLLVCATALMSRRMYDVLWPVLCTVALIFYIISHYRVKEGRGCFIRLAMVIFASVVGAGYPLHAYLREDSSVFVKKLDILNTQTLYLLGVNMDHDGLRYVFHTSQPQKYRFIVGQKEPDYSKLGNLERKNAFIPSKNTPIAYDYPFFPCVTYQEFATACRPMDVVLISEGEEALLELVLKGTNLQAGGKIEGKLGHKNYVAYQLIEVKNHE